MDRKQLWTDFTTNGLIPLPNQATQDNIFGTMVGKKRAYEVYKVVHATLTSNVDREIDYDNWSQIVSNQPTNLRATLSEKANVKACADCVPVLCYFFLNIHLSGASQVDGVVAAELNNTVTFADISEAKRILHDIYLNAWTRPLSNSERQGSNPIVGGISERLLELSMGTLADGVDLFKTNQNDTKSYGDFILMCLPNNLWISVKTKFSRERLLSSGFSNDLVGVGFFTDIDGFTSLHKIRNYKKAGFLAIYLPDTPVDPEQFSQQINTYDEVIRCFIDENIPMPVNINNTPFLRKISECGSDFERLKLQPMQKRSAIGF